MSRGRDNLWGWTTRVRRIAVPRAVAVAGTVAIWGAAGCGISKPAAQPDAAVVTVDTLITSLSARFPAPDATNVCADLRLALTFTVPVALGATGKIQIWRVGGTGSPDTVVDTVDVAATTTEDTIGGRHFIQNRPVTIDGMDVAVYLHRAAMAAQPPNQSYYVTVDDGVFVATSATHASLGAITTPTTWRFATVAASPASPAAITVALDGSGDFCSVQGAIDAIPAGNTSPVTVTIKRGTYREIVLINGKNNVTLHGEERHGTIIAYANNNTLQGAAAGTSNRAMVSAERSNGLVVENMTLHNLTAQGGSQAEALRVDPGDQVILRDADFLSLQDTLLLNGRVYVTNCYVEGNVDFIWGRGTVYFDNCEIRTVVRPGYNVQSRNVAGSYGYVFVDSKITTSTAGIFGHVLARIDATAYPASNVAYINCELGSHISPAGWLLTNATDTSMIHFWEYQSRDAGGALVDVSQRHPASHQMTDQEAVMLRDKSVVFASPAPAWNPQP